MPEGRLQLGPTPEEALKNLKAKKLKFSKRVNELSEKIIASFNADKVPQNRKELIDTEERKLVVALMVQRIIFNLEHGSFADRIEGNEYATFSRQIKIIKDKLQEPKNSTYLNNGYQLPEILDAAINYFESNKKNKDGSTNFLAKDIAIRIVYAWRMIGYTVKVNHTKDKLPKTSFSVFVKITKEIIQNYLAKTIYQDNPKIVLEFFDLKGLDVSLKEFSTTVKISQPPLLTGKAKSSAI